MITGTGTDIIEISRIKSAISSKKFIDRVFTPEEQNYCRYAGVSAERFAGRFAAKEAVAKALGCSLSWLDVEILPDLSGRPVVRLSNKAQKVADGRQILVSISHCRSYAIAYAIVESN